jgi:hypothetical protein
VKKKNGRGTVETGAGRMRMAFWWFISKVKGVECLCVGNVSILHRPSHPIPTPTSRERPAPLTKSGIAVRRELRKSGTLSFLVASFFISTDADGGGIVATDCDTFSRFFSPAVGRELRDPNYFPPGSSSFVVGPPFWNSTD